MTALFSTTAASGSSLGTAAITAADDTLTLASAHGLVDGQVVVIASPTGGADGVLVPGAPYYVANATDETMQLRYAPGSPVLEFASDGAAVVDNAEAVYEPKGLRHALGGLVYKSRDSGIDLGRLGARPGIFANTSSQEVTLSGSVVTVHPTNAWVNPVPNGANGGGYLCAIAADSHTLTAPDGAATRIDILVAEVYDTAEDSTGLVGARTRLIDGVAESLPSAPGVPPGALRLATFTVPSASSGNPPTISFDVDRTVAAGGILPVPDNSRLPAVVRRTGDYVDVADTKALVRYDGAGSYETVASARGFQYGGTVLFTSNSTFAKASYPGLRAIRARCQAGGGAGGGAPSTSGSQSSSGSGGQGGGYAEAWILASALGASESVTVGTAGSGVAGGIGGGGGNSSLGSLCVAPGGAGGVHAAASSTVNGIGQSSLNTSGTGDLVIPGQPGGLCIHSNDPNNYQQSGSGGSSQWGVGAQGRRSSTGADGYTGSGRGAGGGGCANGPSSAARAGAAGTAGAVRIDLYY